MLKNTFGENFKMSPDMEAEMRMKMGGFESMFNPGNSDDGDEDEYDDGEEEEEESEPKKKKQKIE